MASDSTSMLRTVGQTPLVQLKRVVPSGSADVFLKLEYFSPTGSYKDRLALGLIEAAEKRGDLRPGMTVLEWTGGSTGIGLAFVCAVKGYKCRIVSSNAVASEKLRSMQIFGAQLDLVHSADGKFGGDLVERMMARAREIKESSPSQYFFVNQMVNKDMPGAYAPLAEELLQQLGGRKVHAYCACTGTAGMLVGVGRVLLKSENMPGCRIVAFEPATCSVLAGGRNGPHGVEGVAPGFVPPQFDRSVVKEARGIDEEAGRAMAVRLAREEGIFAGTSTGLNVVGALQLAKELGPGHTVITVACDSGLKYLAGSLYSHL